MGRKCHSLVATISVTIILLSFAGCIGVKPDTADPTPASTTPAQGQAAQISVTTAVNNTNVQYITENDSVRYPIDGSREYAVTSFDKWADTKAAYAAADEVQRRIQTELSQPTGVNTFVRTDTESHRVSVKIYTVKDSDGNIVSTPTVDVTDVTEVTPGSVNATVTLNERTYQTDFTVNVTTETQMQT